MPEEFFAEMKRYVRFGPDDEQALRDLLHFAAPHFARISEEFYARLREHDEARAVFSGPDQIERLKGSLREWMALLLSGPWDEAYYQRRARIGRVHVGISLPQRYMFGAMDLIRLALTEVAQLSFSEDLPRRLGVVLALHKIMDLELAIMLETYREAFVDKVQYLERFEKSLLERRLAISEARYEEIVEKGEALIATFDGRTAILLFNRRCEELTGLTRADALGRSFCEVFVRTQDRGAVEELLAHLPAGQRVQPYEGPVPNAAATPRLVRWHFTTLPHTAGPMLCAMGMDVTEERDLAARTRRAERLAALGTMAAGLAHEIRNPLNAAHLQLSLLLRRLQRAGLSEVEGALEAAELAAGEMKRLAGLVEEFLQFARPQPLRRTRVDLRETAQVIVSLVGPEAAHAGVELELEGESTLAELDDERVKQVILNLTRNAIEAAGRGGHVRLGVGARDGAVRLEVEDDGPGLPSADAPIFEPFYTTKEGGTGLGLAIVHRIVGDHGGRVGVDSRPGRTVFAVEFPP